MAWLPRAELLTFEEIERVARVFVERFGIDSIRLTGGEPTVRARLRSWWPSWPRLGVDLALTTNGVTLEALAATAGRAGLRRVNISSTRCDASASSSSPGATSSAVLDGIDAALEAGLAPVKLNVVLRAGRERRRGRRPSPTFGRDKGVVVRFIEFMPLDADGGWSTDEVVPGRRDRRRHRRRVPARAGAPRPRAGGPLALPSTGRARSASSTRSPSRSARPATASASPPTASCAPACSPPTRWTCGRSCAAAATTTALAGLSRTPSRRRGRATNRPGRVHPAPPIDVARSAG